MIALFSLFMQHFVALADAASDMPCSEANPLGCPTSNGATASNATESPRIENVGILSQIAVTPAENDTNVTISVSEKQLNKRQVTQLQKKQERDRKEAKKEQEQQEKEEQKQQEQKFIEDTNKFIEAYRKKAKTLCKS